MRSSRAKSSRVTSSSVTSSWVTVSWAKGFWLGAVLLLACDSGARPVPVHPTPTVTPTLPATESDTTTAVTSEPAPLAAPSSTVSVELPVVEAEPSPERFPFREPMPSRVLPKDASAMRNANLSPAQCRKELLRRKLPMERQRKGVKGVAEAYRVAGPLNSVTFVTARSPSPYGILDCRLALTLDDLSRILAEHDVSRVRIDNMYRPGARLPGRRKKSQHGYGLAIDLVSMTLTDGTVLDVEADWGSGIDSVSCGPEAVLQEPTEHSVVLRNIACAMARAGLFHHILTPGHDAAHKNHLHLDIKRAEKTLLIQ